MMQLNGNFDIVELNETSVPTLATMDDVNKLIKNNSDYRPWDNDSEYMSFLSDSYVGGKRKGTIIYKNNDPVAWFSYSIKDKFLENSININSIFIDKQFQRKGIASKLFSKIEKEVESILEKGSQEGVDVNLNVKDCNSNAINFYSSIGFEKLGNSELGHYEMQKSYN